MLIEHRHLRHFLTVYETGNFNAAARRLHISQPALSKSIHRMEELLGHQLFDRTPKPVPTHFGEVMNLHARAILAGIADMTQAVADFQGMTAARINAGAGPLMADIVMAPAVSRILKEKPQIKVRIHIDNYSKFPAMLRNREIDFYVADVAEILEDPEFEIRHMMKQEIIWFCRPRHPILRNKQVRLHQLFEYPVAAPEPPYRMMEQFNRAVQKDSGEIKKFQVSVICSHYSTLKEIVRGSDCISGALPAIVAEDIRKQNLVRIPVTGNHNFSHPGLVTLKNRLLHPAALLLIEEIGAWMDRVLINTSATGTSTNR